MEAVTTTISHLGMIDTVLVVVAVAVVRIGTMTITTIVAMTAVEVVVEEVTEAVVGVEVPIGPEVTILNSGEDDFLSLNHMLYDVHLCYHCRPGFYYLVYIRLFLFPSIPSVFLTFCVMTSPCM